METSEPQAQQEQFADGGGWHPIVGFAASTVFVILVVLYAPRFFLFLLPHHPMAFEIASRGLPMLLLCIGYAIFVRIGDKIRTTNDQAIALPLRRRGLQEFGLGCVIAGVMVSLCVGLILAFGGINFHANLSAATMRHTGAVLIMTLVAALLEELMFRGYPFQRLALGLSEILEKLAFPQDRSLHRWKVGIGRVAAIVIFSFLFGAIHLSNPGASVLGFINTIAIGVMFAIAYFKTDALWLPFGLHFGWNFVLGVVFGLPVSGLSIFATFMHGIARGPRWLTGGSYGIEASATAMVVILASTILLWLSFRGRKQSTNVDEAGAPSIQ